MSKPAHSPVADRCQILVKSFRRLGALERLVQSVRQFYPELDLLIADDSFDLPPRLLPPNIQRIQSLNGIQWLQLPFDTGLAAGRNRLVAASTKPVLVLCDDDFVFTEETRLENLLTVLDQEPLIGLAAGLVRENGDIWNWSGHFKLSGRHLRIEPLATPWHAASTVRYRRTDLALNFFAARRQLLEQCPWDERFKITGEHLDFFLTLHEGGVPVVYTPDVVVEHRPEWPHDYRPYRQRMAMFRPLLSRKWNLVGLPDHPRNIEVVTSM